jgi:membrane associated rhomboid family serine protease
LIPIRDENPTRRRPVVTVALILINVVVFIYQITQSPEVQQRIVFTYGAIPLFLTRDFLLLPQFPARWITLITSMFLHGGFLHLGGNMLYLWIFGNNVEDYLGHVKFVVFYVICGAVAALTHTAAELNSSVPMIGASGAISGILGAYLILYPRARVVVMLWFLIFVRFVRVPAFAVLGIWFLMQVTSVFGGEDGIAWYAHIGGFIFGLLTVRMLGGQPPRQPYFA